MQLSSPWVMCCLWLAFDDLVDFPVLPPWLTWPGAEIALRSPLARLSQHSWLHWAEGTWAQGVLSFHVALPPFLMRLPRDQGLLPTASSYSGSDSAGHYLGSFVFQCAAQGHCSIISGSFSVFAATSLYKLIYWSSHLLAISIHKNFPFLQSFRKNVCFTSLPFSFFKSTLCTVPVTAVLIA